MEFYVLFVRVVACLAGCNPYLPLSGDNLSGAVFNSLNECRSEAPSLIADIRKYRHQRDTLEWWCIRRPRPPETIHRAECDALGPEQACPPRRR